MRALLLAALLAWAAAAEAGLNWDSLWLTPDQRGEQLLKQGNPAAAAGAFRDPRRKAYAELQAGDYTRAARDFAAFGDGDSLYNRGNALARAGDLQAALKAYDAALARDPDDRDARHNRDLVAEALKRQPPKQPSSTAGGQQGSQPQNGGQQAQSGCNGQSGQPGNPNKTGQSGKSNGSGNDGQNRSGQDKTGAAQANTGSGWNQGGSGQGRPPPAQAAQNGQPAAPSPQPGRTGQQTGANPPGQDTATSAQADAAAALQGPPNGKTVSDATLSERQLAQQDWLRRIPDDPGGLLRRKFMIEHMLRQQGGQP